MREIGKINRTFISFTFGFLILSLSLVLASNAFFTTKKLKRDYFVTLELKNDISKDDIQKFEEELLKNPNIKAVKFLGKEEAFSNLQKEYEIIIPKAENPLPDSLIVSFEKDVNLKAIQETYDVDKRVREIYFDKNFYEVTKNRITISNMVLVGGIVLSLISLFQITTLLRGAIIREYMLFSVRNPQRKNNFSLAKNRNFMKLLGGAIVSLLLFFNGYVILSKKIQMMIPSVTYQSFKQIFLIQIVAYGIALILLNQSANKVKKTGV